MHYVYVLKSEKTSHVYTGSTDDLQQRLKTHNSGNVKSTRAFTPWKVSWYCAFTTKKRALDFEKYLKTGSGIAFARKRLLS